VTAARTITLHTVEDTLALGARLAAAAVPGLKLNLLGDLGAGKTTLVRGLVRALPGGAQARVKSPTYALCHSYATTPRLWHVDLYRLSGGAVVETLGVFDPVGPDDVTVTEWADRAPGLLQDALTITLAGDGDGPRTATLEARGETAQGVLAALGQGGWAG
jgi:tRNA threonylcarbamoyladenosine biosynthesis protein TsaE